MKKGDTVYHFSLAVDFIKDEVRFGISEHKVIGVNDKRIVIDDADFTRLDFKESRINDVFERVGGYHFNCLSYYDEIKVNYYSANDNEKTAKTAMKKWAEEFMYEKFGRYSSKQFLLDKI